MMLKCPQCSALLEGAPGQEATCEACGFTAKVPERASSTSRPRGAAKTHGRDPAVPVESDTLAAPFSFLAGVVGLATFYLAEYWFPFLVSAASVGLGLYAYLQLGGRKLALAAAALGALALVLSVLTVALS